MRFRRRSIVRIKGRKNCHNTNVGGLRKAKVILEKVELKKYLKWNQFSSVQFSRSVVFDSLRPHESQHTRLPYPSPTPGVPSDSCPLRPWCHPTISSSVVSFSSCLQSFPASGSFQMSQLVASGGHGIGVSSSTSVFPMNTQDWSLRWISWISL